MSEPTRIAFKTFGCKANSLDTDALQSTAAKLGFAIVDEKERADAFVINSCTVTSHADRDARQTALHYKRKNPLALVGVVGCYSQVAKDELLALPEIDFVLGTANKGRVLELIQNAFERTEWKRDSVEETLGYLPENFPGSRLSRASIKIQDGCNFSCSYCIIPKARGRSRSLPIENILQQIQDAQAQGFEEVVLTGIHLGHYGWDRGSDLPSLLKAILKSAEGPRIRVSSLDPFEIPDEMIDLLGEERRFCPHFHIALQSGSDSVLKGMRRIYKAEEFHQVTAKIEKKFPSTFIGIDLIVGFPGETAALFEESVRSLESTFWTKLHVFSFSERKGTKAANLPGKVVDREIHERSARLRELSEARYQRQIHCEVGKSHRVLLEKPAAAGKDWFYGRTENYFPTLTWAPGAREKQIVPAESAEVSAERLVSKLLQ